jgi:hypothetical protein
MLLSIDIGIKNMAYVIFDNNNQPVEYNKENIDGNTFIDKLNNTIKLFIDVIHNNNITEVIIEKQNHCNTTLTSLFSTVYTVVKQNNITINIFQPKTKKLLL